MPDLTAEIKTLTDQIVEITRKAHDFQVVNHPDCTGTWWQIENIPLATFQYYAEMNGQKPDWDANKGRFRMQASDWRSCMTLFIYSIPVKARMIYEPCDEVQP